MARRKTCSVGLRVGAAVRAEDADRLGCGAGRANTLSASAATGPASSRARRARTGDSWQGAAHRDPMVPAPLKRAPPARSAYPSPHAGRRSRRMAPSRCRSTASRFHRRDGVDRMRSKCFCPGGDRKRHANEQRHEAALRAHRATPRDDEPERRVSAGVEWPRAEPSRAHPGRGARDRHRGDHLRDRELGLARSRAAAAADADLGRGQARRSTPVKPMPQASR